MSFLDKPIFTPSARYEQAQVLWKAISKIFSPLEYLLFNINMIFLIDGYYNFDHIQRAANLL
jgi:hypothetical protein